VLRAFPFTNHLSGRGLAIFALILVFSSSIHSQQAGGSPQAPSSQHRTQEFIKAPDSLISEGVPPVPASIARDVKPYVGIYGLPL
jgi:hypothetical protein